MYRAIGFWGVARTGWKFSVVNARVVRDCFLVLAVSLALALATARSAAAATVEFVGSGGYSYVGDTAEITAQEVANFDPAGTYSGSLKLELWAVASPYTGVAQVGYKLAEYRLGQLYGGFDLSSINSGTIPFAAPPNGTWYVVLLLTEYVAASGDSGYVVRDYIAFTNPIVIGTPPPPPPPPSVSPQVGLWWNPNESGSGYAIDYRHGVMVMTIYSYSETGTAQWYLVSGPLVGNTLESTLDTYAAGQCISCSYTGRPTPTGNAGTITVVFSSSTTATVYLPGGRVTQIEPQAF